MRPRSALILAFMWTAGITIAAYGAGADIDWLNTIGSQIAGGVVGIVAAFYALQRAAVRSALALIHKRDAKGKEPAKSDGAAP